MRTSLLFILVLMIALCACSDRETDIAPDTNYQFDYFPLRVGQVIEYRLDSLVYGLDAFGRRAVDTISSRIEERVTDSIQTPSGEVRYIIIRSELRPDGRWQPIRTIQAGRDRRSAWRSEDQFRIMKMVFPMTRRSEWDGLTWINRDVEVEIRQNRIRPFSNWAFEVDSIDIPRIVGTFSFPKTLVITEANDQNAIEKRFSRVIYALGVGPVYIEQWILDSQYCNTTPPPTDCLTRPWDLKAERGYILRQTILRY